MPLQATSGAASYDAFGGGAPVVPAYIEEVFSTYLYTGTGSTPQTITNGIDLTGKGGLVWIKVRNHNIARNHILTDTVRGNQYPIFSDLTAGQVFDSDTLPSFTSTGFSVGDSGGTNQSGRDIVSWTFRKQPKFFDIVTYTGDGNPSRVIPHNLGSTPGMIISKTTSTTGDWRVVTPAVNNQVEPNKALYLNDTSGEFDSYIWSAFSSTSITVSSSSPNQANYAGRTYVAYLFAHDAGGFGLTGTDNVISCGVAVDGDIVNLGYEPQWVLFKRSNGTSNWFLYDTMRGMPVSGNSRVLWPNLSDAENATVNYVSPNATGFNFASPGGTGTWIYIAIRRGPMRVPTVGTSVFDTQLGVSSATATIASGFVTDAAFALSRPDDAFGYGRNIYSRLQGDFQSMNTTKTDGESTAFNSSTISFDQNNGIKLNGGSIYNTNWVYEQFRRAPSFFDVVCYTGTGAAMTVAHNLTVAPELIILKSRNNAESWMVYAAPLGNNRWLALNSSFESDSAGLRWNDTTPTSSVFSVGKFSGTTPWSSGSGYTYVAYLFATCPGISKVGSYTGNGTTQAIACGFTGGARLVLIKRTDASGDWYVYDTARGMTVMTDPYLLLNSIAAETATLGSVITSTGGFTVNAAILAAINTNAATYIFLAIA
jgi:hypothetical protein